MTISEFIWGLIWFTAFTVAVVAIVFMVKSIWKDCQEIGYGVKNVVRWWRKRKAYKTRTTRQLLEEIVNELYSSTEEALADRTRFRSLKYGTSVDPSVYYIPAECDYAYGNCFTCARDIPESYGNYKYEKYCVACNPYGYHEDLIEEQRESEKNRRIWIKDNPIPT